MFHKKAKNLIIATLFIFSIILSTFIWPYLNLNISNITGATGSITQQDYSTDSDTIRYVFFIVFPLTVFFFSFLFFKNYKIRSFTDLIKYPENAYKS